MLVDLSVSYLSDDLPWHHPDAFAIYHVYLKFSAAEEFKCRLFMKWCARRVKRKATDHMGVNIGHNPKRGHALGREVGGSEQIFRMV